MSVWNKFISRILGNDVDDNYSQNDETSSSINPKYAFVDTEIGLSDHKIRDIGSIRHDGAKFHGSSINDFQEFINDVDYICGHNIIHHDAKYLFPDSKIKWKLVDTLYLSPLLFPERPYHRLLKDDKLLTDQLNNPVNDCEKAKTLLFEEIERWHSLPSTKKRIYRELLYREPEFSGFLDMVRGDFPPLDICNQITLTYAGKLCSNANIISFAEKHPVSLAYALALIDTSDYRSVTPGWVLKHYPEVENIIKSLRHTPCSDSCDYCRNNIEANSGLKRYFGYDHFRTYNGEPLQEKAVDSALQGESLLAIFPTGGGKSITFQLPALMAGHAVHGLTVVISPLQSLMKDQVDNLADRGITDAVTINGMLDPISRSLAIDRVMSGDASILYISPEMLRSSTIEHILMNRHVVRFVIDEAHCFSSWGQDFRVDYLYIGKFIARYMRQKQCKEPIPVSCFTATAKQKVIQDICDYFKNTIGLELKIFATSAARTNLHYSVIHADDDDHKYSLLRSLIYESDCPTIVYVSRTKRTKELSGKLTRDGVQALPFNGKMSSEEKIANQEAFMNDSVRVIVATSAFGMGVDKSDVGMVIHYDISDSLENYVQEAGRAGRDPSLDARCYVLYSDNDLDKHFILLNQTKLSLSEIQQVWKSVKDLTRQRESVSCSALEIARQAGWDDSVSDIETRVRTAIAALEHSGYIERGNNIPHVYATGITVKNVDEARQRLSTSKLFENDEVEHAVRVIKSLISAKHIAKAQGAEAESRIDYLADILGLNKREVISVVERMRQEGILADSKDISAYLLDAGDTLKKSKNQLEKFASLEKFILNHISDDTIRTSCKQLNDDAVKEGIESSREKDIRTLLYFLSVKGYAHKQEDAVHNLELKRTSDYISTLKRFEKRLDISRFSVEWLYGKLTTNDGYSPDKKAIQFSVVELLNDFKKQNLLGATYDVKLEDIEEALLYLSKIGALKLDGGFLVLYNAMKLRRLKDSKLRYRQSDYSMLNDFYKLKIQQVHIVGEYANLMVSDYNAALQYVTDYFTMDYRKFINKYFKEDRKEEIERNITPAKYKQLFGQLSIRQREIISDKESACIVVAAGPGSGKTRVLVHKLASLLLLEDVKHEQLLMLTFSRAAATEFKQRLMSLIGNAAHFVEIKTFHSYSFDLLGRMGSLDESHDVVMRAANMIENGEVEPNRIGKTVLVIDEAQDMGAEEFALVHALIHNNEDMRVIAVGDDDQNIYEFRGSDSGYMYRLAQEQGSRVVEMTENYRTDRHPVAYANEFLKSLGRRIKNSPIVSMGSEDGFVAITHYKSKILYQPLIDELIRDKNKGSTCVLTQKNEEAAIIVSLLKKHGINAKLIQSIDGLRFWNVAEVRYFLRYIDKRITSPLISDELWAEAISTTEKRYGNATSYQYLKRCIELFQETNKAKYITDFKEFLFESSTEDFCDLRGCDVVVSTIHKSKGREFDNVYMLVSGGFNISPSLLRRYYVGITRCKHRLSIHTNTDYFGKTAIDRYISDDFEYPMPDDLILQLTHKDVFLDFFKNKKKEILALKGGDTLTYGNFMLHIPQTGQSVVKLSQKMQRTISEWENRGFKVSEAKVRFVVAWKPKDAPKDETETAVLLADLYLKRTILTATADNCNQ